MPYDAPEQEEDDTTSNGEYYDAMDQAEEGSGASW